MNKNDRKQLADIIARLQPLAEIIETARDELRDMAEAEREKFNNMTEGLQQGERGQAIEQAADAMESAVSELENLDLEDICGNLEGI